MQSLKLQFFLGIFSALVFTTFLTVVSLFQVRDYRGKAQTTGTVLSLTVLLHGIGKGGDNVNPTSIGTTNPLHPQRTATVELFNVNNQALPVKSGTVTFNSTAGNFQGTIDVGPPAGGVATGAYTLKVSIPQYLKRAVPGILSITDGQIVSVPEIRLVTGNINNDHRLAIDDYNLLLECFSDLDAPETTCTAAKKMAADLTDDGNVNQFDYNLLLREFSVQQGDDGGLTPAPTGVSPSQPIPTATRTPTPTQPAPTVTLPGGATVPAQVLNLTNWKITLPTGSSGSPTEIKQPALATFAVDPWLIVANGNSVRFRSPVNGVTTSGSSYPRSELREMTNNGAANAAWSSTTGTHTFTYEAAVTAVPQTKKHIVVGQIHDGSDDVIVIRLEYPKLFIDIGGSDGPTLDANYTLGKKFTAKFEVNGGQTRIYYNNSTTPAYTLTKNYSGAYFKLGAYTQSNCSTEGSSSLCNANNYGEAVVYSMSVAHQ